MVKLIAFIIVLVITLGFNFLCFRLFQEKQELKGD